MDISAETLEILEQLFERAKRICLQKGLTEQEVQLTNLPAGVLHGAGAGRERHTLAADRG